MPAVQAIVPRAQWADTPVATASRTAVQTDPGLSVQCRNISVRFFTDRRSVTAIRDLSLDVGTGEFLTLLGPSGCGKSTFLRVVADLVQPSQGELQVLGVTPEAARLRRDIGFVFQDAALLPWRTALQNVELPLEVARGKAHGVKGGTRHPARTAGTGGPEGL
ncbi:ATP-binding cassette domain-containing protein [Polaromonas sp. P1(28)-13]|nr:ATP-binding cassette domain-containing protein [Polaromonas sp. P1-6]UUZ74485.1 ATP-binding cassette domain-containing protein [Polaromonas sp. P1(28)-13]